MNNIQKKIILPEETTETIFNYLIEKISVIVENCAHQFNLLVESDDNLRSYMNACIDFVNKNIIQLENEIFIYARSLFKEKREWDSRANKVLLS